MKALGLVRRIDELGRVVIPKDIRRSMGIHKDSPLEMFFDEETNGLILIPYHNNISSKIRGIAQNLSSISSNQNECEIAAELKKIAKKLENLDY